MSKSVALAALADIGGYYKLDLAKADAVMRPSGTFNAGLSLGSYLTAKITVKELATKHRQFLLSETTRRPVCTRSPEGPGSKNAAKR